MPFSYYFLFKDATAVVQVEDTKLLKGTSDSMEEKEIEIMTEIQPGQDIRYLVFSYMMFVKQ